MHNKQINIGITFFWGNSYNDIWSNGAGQNMFFLKELFEQMPFVGEVYFVYWGNDPNSISDALKLDAMKVKLYSYEEVVDKTDVLIEGTLTLDQFHEKAFREHGAKIVSFRMGNDFIMDQEKYIRGDSGGRAFNGTKYDSIWVIPQIAKSNTSYLQIMTKTEVKVVPHLWSPFFINADTSMKEKNLHFEYVPGRKAKRISVFEPNISLSKTVHTPALIAEAAYCKDKSAIEHVYLCCTYEKRELPVFHDFIGWTELLRDGILSVEGRFVMPQFLAIYTDIVVSYQWELGLNYAYYETLYGGYPLVHNSKFLKEAGVGYYYEEFDALGGADALLDAIYHYDENIDAHRAKNNQFLETFSPYNKENIEEYTKLLSSLF